MAEQDGPNFDGALWNKYLVSAINRDSEATRADRLLVFVKTELVPLWLTGMFSRPLFEKTYDEWRQHQGYDIDQMWHEEIVEAAVAAGQMEQDPALIQIAGEVSKYYANVSSEDDDDSGGDSGLFIVSH